MQKRKALEEQISLHKINMQKSNLYNFHILFLNNFANSSTNVPSIVVTNKVNYQMLEVSLCTSNLL